MDYTTNNHSMPGEHTGEQLWNKDHRMRGIFLLIFTTCIFLLITFYVVLGIRYMNVFFPGTTVNGIDASGMNPEELAQKIMEKADNYSLTLHERGLQEEQIRGSRIRLHVEVEAEKLQKLLEEQNPALWLFQSLGQTEYGVELNITFDETLLTGEMRRLDCMDAEQVKAPVDAYAEYIKDSGYRIVPEQQGNKVRKKKLKLVVTEALQMLEDSLSLEEMDCYYTPKVCESDEGLNEKVQVLNEYINMTVTYQFGDRKEVLDGVQISRWIRDVHNGKIVLDEKRIKRYVSRLADTYDTAYKIRNFKTSYGQVVRIDQGDYGFMIDQKKEMRALKKNVASGKSLTREPVYAQQGADYGGSDYGDTYVELNLAAQHLFLYKKGRLVLETDFVSGDIAKGYGTPCGIYAVTYKQRNAVLKGADYRSKVSYWMPFNRGIGLHDADWRTKFGGEIYINNGSHGCINLPPDKAKVIYETIDKGTPVICYALNGTKNKKK